MAPTATGSKARWARGVRRVWAGAGPQRAAYGGGGISCGLAHGYVRTIIKDNIYSSKLYLVSLLLSSHIVHEVH